MINSLFTPPSISVAIKTWFYISFMSVQPTRSELLLGIAVLGSAVFFFSSLYTLLFLHWGRCFVLSLHFDSSYSYSYSSVVLLRSSHQWLAWIHLSMGFVTYTICVCCWMPRAWFTWQIFKAKQPKVKCVFCSSLFPGMIIVLCINSQ